LAIEDVNKSCKYGFLFFLPARNENNGTRGRVSEGQTASIGVVIVISWFKIMKKSEEINVN
ncbi:MAG: hypothetical protein EZS28_021363, partial [Streblomastix strix]